MLRPALLPRLGFAMLAAGLLAPGGATRAQVTGNAVFGQQGVAIDLSATINGVVASNGNVSVNSFSTFNGLTGGGSLLGNPLGDFTVNGSVTFNGNVSTGQFSKINGPINSGGDVDLGPAGTVTQAITARGNVSQAQSATTNGNVLAGGNFSNGDFSVVNGNASANGSVTVGGTVNGNVTFGTTLSVGPFGKITGQSAQGMTTVNPATYTPAQVPAAIPFTSGGPDVTSGGTLANPLAPGKYGNLTIPTFGNLFLTAGNYFFNSFTFNGDTIHLLNLSANSQINIFVTNNVVENTFANVTVNEQPFASADPKLASNVLLETLGNYSQNALGSVKFFGTIFAPNGDISVGQFSSETGSLIAGDRVNISVGFNQTFAPSAQLAVPEPRSSILLGLGVASVLLVVLRRARRPPVTA